LSGNELNGKKGRQAIFSGQKKKRGTPTPKEKTANVEGEAMGGRREMLKVKKDH